MDGMMDSGLNIPSLPRAALQPINQSPAMQGFDLIISPFLRQQAFNEGLHIPSAAAGIPASKKAIAPAMALFRPPSSF